jgi:hypothetical protein
MRGHYPDWIGHFHRDGLASLGDCEHPIEITRPSIKTVQLANEAKLFDWIAKLLRELQTSREGGMRLLTAPHRVHRGNSEARLQMHLLGTAATGVVQCEQRSLRPAMTFRKQRHRQEDGRGSGSESDTDFNIAFGTKAPFQRRADVIESGKVRRAFCSGR